MNAPTALATVAEPRPALIAGARPRPIVPTDIEQVWRLATMIAKAGLAPRDLETPEKISVAIMHGLEIGLPPMMALQRIAVINGRPAVWGDAVPAIALATGLVEDFFESITGEGDSMVATCRLKRKGVKSQAERTFSVSDAKRAGLWDTREKVTRRKKDGTTYEARNESPWHCYPKRMLQMRSRVAFRDLFADALGGLYIAEELIGIESDEDRANRAKDVTPARSGNGGKSLPPTIPAQRTAEQQPLSEPAQESHDDEVIEDEVETASPPKPVTRSKPLPPLAKSRNADPGDIPASLRRQCPPADEPEAYREWLVTKLAATKTDEDVQLLWDSHVAPNIEAEQIIPTDAKDLLGIFMQRRQDIAGQ
jgi:hypothetical protein